MSSVVVARRLRSGPDPRRGVSAPFRLLLITLILGWFACEARAQEEPRAVETSAADVSVQLSGTLQYRLSYGFDDGVDTERLGFGVRRARLRATAELADRFGAHFDIDLGGGGAQSVDLYAYYQPSPRVRLRAGYLAGAQPRAYIFTSHTRIDAVDRAAVAERWARGTIGSSGRDFGAELRYQTDAATVAFFLHNGDGSFDRARGNYRESVSGGSATRGSDRTVLAAGTFVSLEPPSASGLEIGGFAGVNGARNPNTAPAGIEAGRRYVTYAGHVYWGAAPGSRPVRLKADLIGIRYAALVAAGRDIAAQHSLGYAFLGAVRLTRAAEAFARVEQFHPFIDQEADATYMTAGASYSLSALRGEDFREKRLTLAYANALPAAAARPDVHLVVLQVQIVF